MLFSERFAARLPTHKGAPSIYAQIAAKYYDKEQMGMHHESSKKQDEMSSDSGELSFQREESKSNTHDEVEFNQKKKAKMSDM